MSNFKPVEFDIHGESASAEELRVVKIDTQKAPEVKAFQLPNIKPQSSYSAVKGKYGPLAATDSERVGRRQKDRRFSISPLLRDPLSVEDEEKRVIEEKVRARVTAVSDQARAEAEISGYEDGFKKGHEEAFRKFQEEARERLAFIDRFIESAEAAKAEIFKANERFLLDLVYRISKMVMLKDLSADRNYVLRLANELIKRIGIRDNVTIRIHPDDAASIGMLRDGLEKSLGALTNLNVEVSQDVARGGCRVETQWNSVDATVETQLQAIHSALIGEPRTGEGNS